MRRLSTRPGGGRTVAIVILVIACVPLMALLAVQTDYAVRSHRATAESVLRDYAALGASEMQRRLATEVGYRGYYAVISELRRVPSPDDMGLGSTVEGEAQLLVARTFGFDGDLVASSRQPDDEWIEHRLATIASVEEAGGEGFTGLHRVMPDGSSRTYVVAAAPPVAPLERLVGFEVDPEGLAEWLARAVDSGPVLPPTLADGAVDDDVVSVRISDPVGRPLFESGVPFPDELGAELVLDDGYGGVFRDYRVFVGIDPEAADQLVIGGLPRSRLPMLLGLLAVATGLLAGAVWLLYQERALHRLRSNFVSRVSHELRTPLTQIRMFSETLLLERTRGPDEARRSLEIIDREARRLAHLVENLLQFSRGERAELEVTADTLDPASVVADVLEQFGPLLEANDVTVRSNVTAGLTVVTDADALRQILLNLLDNALKYGPFGQEVRVSLSETEDHVRFAVEDEGPGVPGSHTQRIWDRYVRLPRDRRSTVAGTGIGLTVVRDLVTRLGGRCWVEPGGSAGARFVVELPRAQPGRESSHRLATAPSGGAE